MNDPFCSFHIKLLTDKQTDTQTNVVHYITSLADITLSLLSQFIGWLTINDLYSSWLFLEIQVFCAVWCRIYVDHHQLLLVPPAVSSTSTSTESVCCNLLWPHLRRLLGHGIQCFGFSLYATHHHWIVPAPSWRNIYLVFHVRCLVLSGVLQRRCSRSDLAFRCCMIQWWWLAYRTPCRKSLHCFVETANMLSLIHIWRCRRRG